MTLFYKDMVVFFHLSPTTSHLHPLQAENCDTNSRLVVDKDENGKFRLERVNKEKIIYAVLLTLILLR